MGISQKNLEDLRLRLETALLMVDKITVQQILTADYEDVSAFNLIELLIVPILEKIGEGWEAGEYSLSQVYMSGRLCEEVVDIILPPDDPDRIYQPKMAIATLEDFHVLGKRIVYSALRASRFSLENFGRMDTEELIQRVVAEDIQVLLISTLMLPAALHVRQVVDGLHQSGKNVKVLVGGAPFNYDSQLWEDVGADGFGATASEAVRLVHQIMEELT